MAPPVGGVRSTDPYSYSGVDSSEETTLVQVGETSLAQVAQRLQLDANDLLAANPRIANPNSLTPGQEIRKPGTAKGDLSTKVDTTGSSNDAGSRDLTTNASKQMESSIDSAAMRTLLNAAYAGAVPADSGAPAKAEVKRGPSLEELVSDKKYGPDVKKQMLEGLKTVSENANFKKLDPADQATILKTLAANPPLAQEKVSRTLDLFGSANSLSAADRKLVVDGFNAAHADSTYAANLKQLIDDAKFKSLKGPEKTAVLSQAKNYPDARSVKNIDRTLQKDWFAAQDLSDKQRSLKVIARLSQYPPKGDEKIIKNTLDKFIGDKSDYKLDWKSLHVDSGTTYGEGGAKTLTLNKDLISADNSKMVENDDTNHLTLNTVPHEVNHLLNDDKVEKNFKYFQAEYRAWYVGFKAEHGRAPTNQEAMEQRLLWQLNPDSFYGKQAAEAMKDPTEANKLFEFLGKVTGQKVDASNWQTVIKSDPATWPHHAKQAAAPEPEGNFDNY
jgi:hypothetical protein